MGDVVLVPFGGAVMIGVAKAKVSRLAANFMLLPISAKRHFDLACVRFRSWPYAERFVIGSDRAWAYHMRVTRVSFPGVSHKRQPPPAGSLD